MQTQTLVSASALTATGNTAAFEVPLGSIVGESQISLEVEVSAVSGTSPSATFSLQWSDDGADWDTPSPAQSLAAITAVDNVVEEFPILGIFYRVAYTISGTTPSLTTTIRASV